MITLQKVLLEAVIISISLKFGMMELNLLVVQLKHDNYSVCSKLMWVLLSPQREGSLDENEIQVRERVDEIRQNFLGIRDTKIHSFFVSFKVETQDVVFLNITQTFQSDLEWNSHLCL